MKNPIILLLAAAIWTLFFSACTKNSITPTDNQPAVISGTSATPNQGSTPSVNNDALSGKWKIALDSTWHNFSNAMDNKVSIDKYKGTAADYFEFTADGKFYSYENGVVDTATYSVDANENITFNYSVYNGVLLTGGQKIKNGFTIIASTANSLTLYNWIGTTQGVYYTTVILNKE